MEAATNGFGNSQDSDNFLHSEIKIEAEELEDEWWLREPAAGPNPPQPPLVVIKQEVRREPPPLIPFGRHRSPPPLRRLKDVKPHDHLPSKKIVKPDTCPPCTVQLDASEVARYFSTCKLKQEPVSDVTLESLLLKPVPSSEVPPLLITSDKALRYKSSIQCLICRKVCRNRISYLNHMQCHCTEPVFFCKFCSSNYHLAKSVYRHVKLCHPEYPMCTGCREPFRREYELAEHQLTCKSYVKLEKQKIYRCPHCHNYSTTSKGNFDHHLIWKHDINTHEYLFSKFNITETLKSNYELLNNSPRYAELSSNYLVHCLSCNVDFTYDNYFSVHFEQCFKNSNFICPFCCAAKSRFLRENVAEHINRHIQASDKADRCDNCKASFFTRINMAMHRKKMHSTVKEQGLFPGPSIRPLPFQIVNVESILEHND